MSLLSSIETSSPPKQKRFFQNEKKWRVPCLYHLPGSSVLLPLLFPAGSNTPFGFQFKIVSSKYHFVVILWGKTYQTKCCVWKDIDTALSNGIFGSGYLWAPTNQLTAPPVWVNDIWLNFSSSASTQEIVWIAIQKKESREATMQRTSDYCDWRTANSPFRPGLFLGVVQHWSIEFQTQRNKNSFRWQSFQLFCKPIMK